VFELNIHPHAFCVKKTIRSWIVFYRFFFCPILPSANANDRFKK